MRIRSIALAAAVAAALAVPAAAAPLDILPGDFRIDIAPVGPSLTYLEDGAGGADLLLDPFTEGVDEAAQDYHLDLSVSFEPADPAATITGALSIYENADGADLLFGGLLQDYGTLAGDVVQFLFEDDGSTAAGFPSSLVVELAFASDLPGDDPLGNLTDGARYEAIGAATSIAPIPVPASLPLLVGAGAALAAIRGRRRRRG